VSTLRIVVVGGAGFIGSHLVDRLLVEQHVVDVVDDLSTGTLANLATARSLGGELKIHHLDVCSDEFGSLIARRAPEVIVHLGWLPPGRNDAVAMGRSLESVLRVLDAARATQVRKVVTMVPAGALYGEVPVRELPVKEGRAWSPTGAVGVIARAGVELLEQARANDAVEFSALAAASVYGDRQRADGGVVAAFRAARAAGIAPTVHGDGRQVRDFVFIDDAVDALVRATRRGSGLVVNVGTGTGTSIRDLWSLVAGPDAPRPELVPGRPDHVSRVVLSPTRARIHLAWAPWTSLADGLRALSS
jgi:UDP-glucose 4-epimerase